MQEARPPTRFKSRHIIAGLHDREHKVLGSGLNGAFSKHHMHVRT